METTALSGALYARMIEGGAARLGSNRVIVNELNVFPIPDGDTGDNMYMTIDAGSTAVAADTNGPLADTAERIAGGMLLGARGNSGVILSRIFAGISKGFSGVEVADLRTFAAAMERGVEESYRAVQTPVEGTILTVYSDAVHYANARITEQTDFETYFEHFLTELRASLDRTPTLLAVLREAGVVDSGGAGFVYIAEGMQDALRGLTVDRPAAAGGHAAAVDPNAFTADMTLAFGFCTEFMLRLQTAKVGPVDDFDEKPLVDWLIANGESVVAFRDGSLLRVHIHTMTPETILAKCHAYGEFLTMKIENMMLQHHETTIRNNFPQRRKPHKAIGIVAVAAGDGIRETFLSIGADAVVNGGQSMNPSAESFLDAFRTVNADTILVFPNNSNIMMTAEQAAGLYDGADVVVMPSHNIAECYAALSLLDTASGDVERIEADAAAIMQSVREGTVSRASRTTERNGVSVREGDFIGYSDGVIYADSPEAKAAALSLADALGADDFGILLLVRGQDADAGEAEAIREALEAAHPLTEVILLEGGQPIYDYIMILE